MFFRSGFRGSSRGSFAEVSRKPALPDQGRILWPSFAEASLPQTGGLLPHCRVFACTLPRGRLGHAASSHKEAETGSQTSKSGVSRLSPGRDAMRQQSLVRDVFPMAAVRLRLCRVHPVRPGLSLFLSERERKERRDRERERERVFFSFRLSRGSSFEVKPQSRKRFS